MTTGPTEKLEPVPTSVVRRACDALHIVTAAGGLAFTAATFGAFAGAWHWRLDLMSHFRVQFAIAMVVAVIISSALRRWRWVTLWSLALAANLATIVPLYFAPDGPSIAADAPRLRVLQLNALYQHPDNAGLARWLDAQDADLIFVQEFTPQLASELRRTLTRYHLQLSADLHGSRGLGMLVPVKPGVDIEQARIIKLVDAIDRPYIEAFVRLGEMEVAILSAHVAQPTALSEQREQTIELAACADWARQQEQMGRSAVIIGDFNATPWSHLFRTVQAKSGLVNSQRGYGLAGTWPAGLPAFVHIPIDHCLHSAALATVGRRVGPDVRSDHLPLYVELAPRTVERGRADITPVPDLRRASGPASG